MTKKLLFRLLKGYNLPVKEVWEGRDPEYFLDATFYEEIPHTLPVNNQINSGQFPPEIVDYHKFSTTEYRLYLQRLDVKLF